MNLINQLGDEIEVTVEEWRETLRIGELHGWAPHGTLPPPVDFEARQRSQWTKSYLAGAGQMVLRADAARLADAVEAGSERLGSLRFLNAQTARKIVNFLRSGPFVVTGTAEAPPVELDDQLLSLQAVLGQNAGLSPEPTEPVRSRAKWRETADEASSAVTKRR